jgi:hypothetical protein
MTRDHLMGYAPASVPADEVHEQGEYYDPTNWFLGDDPYPLGVPVRHFAEREAMRAQCLKEAREITAFERGEHTPAPSVHFHTYAEEEKRRASLPVRPQQVPALFKPAPKVTPEPDVEMEEARAAALEYAQAHAKRWDLMHAAITRDDNAQLTQLGNLPTYYANTAPSLAQCMGTWEIRVITNDPDEPVF